MIERKFWEGMLKQQGVKQTGVKQGLVVYRTVILLAAL
jgi:hypothetical protein